MKDENKTKEQLINELVEMRQRIAELEASETEHKRAEEVLAEERNLLRTLIDNLPDYIYAKDAESRFVLGNIAAAREVGGTTPDEMLGKTDFDFFPEELAAQYYADEQAIFRSGQSLVNREEPVIDHAGNRLWVLTTKVPLRDSQGQIVGLVGMNRDITERKWAEETLARRAQEMAVLYETSLEINSQPDIPTLLHAIVQRAARLLEARMGALYLMMPDSETLELVVSHNLPGDYVGTRLHLGEGLSGRIAQTGEPMTVSDYRHWEGRAAVYADEPLRRILGVPLKVGNRVIGVISVGDDEGTGEFDEEEIRLVSLFADQAAIAVENNRLFQAEREQRKLAEALKEAAAVVSSTLDPDQVLAHILEQVERVVAGDTFNIMLIQEGHIRTVGRRGYDTLAKDWMSHPVLPIAEFPILLRIVETGEPALVLDTAAEADWVLLEGQSWLCSYVGAPIQMAGSTVGILNVNGTRPGQFGPADARRLEAFASHAATAIENARLYEQARRDAETKAALLQEVNHRVKNNLTGIIGLLYAERRRYGMEDQPAYQSLMDDLTSRVQGLARVHDMLSAAEWGPLPLDELTRQIIQGALQMLPHHKRISVDVTPSPVRVTPQQANSLALVINELATNTVKYALAKRPKAHISVRIALEEDTVLFEFRDDGPGYPEEVLRLERHSVGSYLIQTMVRDDLGGELSLHNDHGAVTTVRFKKDPSGF